MARWKGDIATALLLPTVDIDLMLAATDGNHPFYRDLVLRFHSDARSPHPKLPVLRRFGWGVALQRIPLHAGEYLFHVEASARRNIRKANREGFAFQQIQPNQHLDGIVAVRRSTVVRQGQVPGSLLAEPSPISDPPSSDPRHDYLWFGVLRKGELAAYASCFVSGELASIEHILGHAQHQSQGVVPTLIAGMVEHVRTHHASVRWLAFGGYFGAQPTMRRFKRKMGFNPAHVVWQLDAAPVARSQPDSLESLRIGRMLRHRNPSGSTFCYLEGARALAYHGPALMRALSPARLMEVARSLGNGRRHAFFLLSGEKVDVEGVIEPIHVEGRRAAILDGFIVNQDGDRGVVEETALGLVLGALQSRGIDLVHFHPASVAGDALRRIGHRFTGSGDSLA